MSILSRSADLVYTFRLLRLLTTEWEDTNAFKFGLIDDKGNRTDKKAKTSEEKSAYNPFHRMVFNLKRLVQKAPGGKKRVSSYAAALFLIREHTNMSDKKLLEVMEKVGVESETIINENSEWFITKEGCLAPGIYQLNQQKIANSTKNVVANIKDKVRVEENCAKIGTIFDIDVFEVTHINTNQKLYVTSKELIK